MSVGEEGQDVSNTDAFPDAYLGLGHEPDPDDDVGLYEDDDDDEGFISDEFADLEDTEDEEEWDEEWEAGNEFERNLRHFRVMFFQLSTALKKSQVFFLTITPVVHSGMRRCGEVYVAGLRHFCHAHILTV